MIENNKNKKRTNNVVDFSKANTLSSEEQASYSNTHHNHFCVLFDLTIEMQCLSSGCLKRAKHMLQSLFQMHLLSLSNVALSTKNININK